MGEITEALRRAGGARRRRRQRAEAAPEMPSPAASRAAAAAPAPAEEPPPPSPARSPAAEGAASGVQIPRDRTGDWLARAVLAIEHGGASESFRHFAIKVSRELAQRGARSVLIASALREEGKTTTACNLALALASMAGGRRIALVDLDLRKPRIATALSLAPRVGLERVLLGDAALEEVCIHTVRPPLDVYPVRAPTPGAHEVLASPRLGRLVDDLTTRYDIVVFDSAPVLLVPDTGLIVPHAGGCVAVSRAGRTRRASFQQMLDLLPDGKLLGTFLNEASTPRHSRQYGYYQQDHQDEGEAA